MASLGLTVLYPVLDPVVCWIRATGFRSKWLPLDWTPTATAYTIASATITPRTVRSRKPRVTKRTRHPTSVLDMPDTLALKMSALASTAMHTPRYQRLRSPSSTTRPMANTTANAKVTAAMFGCVLRPTAREPSRLAWWL